MKPARAGTGAAPRAPQGEVRIIGGRWRRSRLPVASAPGLRPTPDRIRETLFNWLGQDLSGWRVLDAFAGSGVLGLEASSRGAASVLLVERDTRLAQALRAACTRLRAEGVTVQGGDGLASLRAAAPASLDLIFLDPPYGAGLLPAALQAAAAALAPGGFVYAETGDDALAVPDGLEAWRQVRAGQVRAHLLRRPASGSRPQADAAAGPEAYTPGRDRGGAFAGIPSPAPAIPGPPHVAAPPRGPGETT